MRARRQQVFDNLKHGSVQIDAAAPNAVAEQTQRHLLADFCRLLGGETIRRDTQSLTVETVATFSPRVRQTLQRILVGDSEKQIALKLGVSQNTVHVYVKAIYRAFGVNSRGELMTFFVSDQWLEKENLR